MASTKNRNNNQASKTAASKKAPATKRKTAAKTSSDAKTSSKVSFNYEIIALFLIALSIYFMVCVYSGGVSGGFIGKYIHKLLIGLFGTCAYVLPPITIILLGYFLFSREERKSAKKYILTFGALLDLAALFHLIYSPWVSWIKAFPYAISGKISGGFFGGSIASILKCMGKSGEYIILICAMLAFVISIFNISVSDLIVKIIEGFRSSRAASQQARLQREQEQAKTQQIPRGVALKPEIEKEISEQQKSTAKPEEIVFHLPEEPEANEDYIDPEIKLYDDAEVESEEKKEEEKKLSDEEKEQLDRAIKEEIESTGERIEKVIEYVYPSIDLLTKQQSNASSANVQEELKSNAKQLIDTLHSFKVDAKVVEISQGPTITRYEIEPAEGVRVNQVTNLSKDIGLRFKADKGVMVAPVPGKSTIGIEIENKNPSIVALREVLECDEFKNHKSKLAVALGKDVGGKPIIMDLAKMPHLLIAGATGAGKSVCINTLVISLLYKADPNEVKLVMIDPKQVELGVYNGIPHLLIPVVKDAKKATGALSWAVQEMTERYSMFERNNVRNIKAYNELMNKNGTPEKKMASIVILIDEFADLMMVAPADVENYVCRIAQLARAAGMHLVIATQRPVVKFITGNIKANVPSRISFMVASVRDSQTILDMGGAEKLIGKGDMLYLPVGETIPMRMQGAFVSDSDVKAVVDAISEGVEAVYDPNVIEQLEKDEGEYEPDGANPGDCDELLPDAIDMAITSGQISTSLLQRRFRIGYNRAGSIIDQMEARGIISALDGNKPRQVLMTREEYNEMLLK